MKKILFLNILFLIVLNSFSFNKAEISYYRDFLIKSKNISDEIKNDYDKILKDQMNSLISIKKSLNDLDKYIELSHFLLFFMERNIDEKDTVESVYDFLIKDLNNISEVISKKIIYDKSIKSNLKVYFEHVNEIDKNTLSGYYYLNSFILEYLKKSGDRSRYINELYRVGDYINNIELDSRWFGFDSKKIIQKYGLEVAKFYSDELSEYLENKDKVKFQKRLKLIRKAFNIYERLIL